MKNSVLVRKIVFSAISLAISLSATACVNDVNPSPLSIPKQEVSSNAVKPVMMTPDQMKALYDGHDDAEQEVLRFVKRVNSFPASQTSRIINDNGSVDMLVKNPDGSFLSKFTMVKNGSVMVTTEVDQDGYLKYKMVIKNDPETSDTKELQVETSSLKYIYLADQSGKTIDLKIFVENGDGSELLIEKNKVNNELSGKIVINENIISKSANFVVINNGDGNKITIDKDPNGNLRKKISPLVN
jgi:hypothetical protein